jgi:biopolymer transport protein ExbD
MAFGVRAGESFNQINITPLTDVFLVLLVIMMLIVPLTEQRVLKVKMPQPGTVSENKIEHQVNVQVLQNGTVKINGQTVKAETEAIQAKIAEEQKKAGTKDIVLSLKSEQNAYHKDVVAVMDAAEGAEISHLQFLDIHQ